MKLKGAGTPWVTIPGTLQYPCITGGSPFNFGAWRKHLYRKTGVCRRCGHDRNEPPKQPETVNLVGIWG